MVQPKGEGPQIRIAKITTTHGTGGELKAIPLSDFRERYTSLDLVYVEGSGVMLFIENIRWHGNQLIVKFVGVDSLEDALSLKNPYLLIDKDDVFELPRDHYYLFEVLGLRVLDLEGKHLGEIKEVLQTGANDVYIVRDDNDREILIPALRQVVKEVDLNRGTMIVVLPHGLME
ncbi:MAG: 16S rRNA processing protein RimM [Clostridia bacterium]|nr:16S rRNA processing protein RimM [Clostridia bacterium]